MIISIIPGCVFLKLDKVYAVEINNKDNIDINSNKENNERKKDPLKNDVNIDDIGGSAKKEINDLYEYINKIKSDHFLSLYRRSL